MVKPAFPFLISAMIVAGFWALEGKMIHWVFLILAGVCFAAAITGGYFLLFGWAMASVLVRAIFAMVPVGLFAGGVIYGLLQVPDLDAQLLRALIAAVVVAGGWIVGYMTGEWRRVEMEQERRRDIIRAAISELELIAKHADVADWDKAMDGARESFKDDTYDVFIYYGHQHATLRRLVGEVEILAWDQISPVMEAFQALDRLERMQDRMDSDAFRTLPTLRRQEGLLRFLRLHARISHLSNEAINALKDGPFRGWMRKIL